MRLITLLVLLSTATIHAQSKLKGVISESEKNQRLGEASIFCPDLNRTSLSNSNGEFEMYLPKGSHNLRISHVGYQTRFETVEIQDADKEINFSLEHRNIEIQEVVVSGASPRLQEESALKIEVLRTSDIQLEGNITTTDALAKIPGVNMVSTGSQLSRPVIRGLSGNRILTMADGVRLENQQWDDEHGLGISETGFNRIEVIKGPSTLLYGPEAMGGVVNFIEEQPAATGHIEGDLDVRGFSNILGFDAQAGIKGATDKYFWSVRGGGRSYADYYSGKDERVANSRFSDGNARLTFGTSRNWGSTSLTYSLNGGFYGIVEPFDKEAAKGGEEEEEFPREAEAPYHTVLNQRLVSRTNLRLGKALLKTTLGFQDDQRAEYEGDTLSKDGHINLDMHLQSYTYDVKYQFPIFLKYLSGTIGTQGMYQQNTNGILNRLVPDASVTDAAGFFISKVNFRKFSIEGGLRYDNRSISASSQGGFMVALPPFKENYANKSGSIGIVYDVNEHLLLRSNYGTGYRAPNLVELLSNGYKVERRHFDIGNSNFTAEKNKELDFTATLDFRNFTFEGTLYQNKIANYIYYAPTGSTTIVGGEGAVPVYNYLQGNATLKGAEAELSIHPASVSWLLIESNFSTINATLDAGGYLPYIPAKRFRHSILVKLKDIKRMQHPFVRLTLMDILAQKRVAQNELTSNAYDLVNLAIGGTRTYKRFSVEWAFTVNNLLDKVYIDHLSRLNYAVPLGANVYNQGINVGLNLRIPFMIK